MNLKKAVFYKSEKRVAILISMLVFVMFAIYLSLSLSFSKYRIQNELKERNLPETILTYDTKWEDIDDPYYEDVTMSSVLLKEFLDEKGHSYKDVPYTTYYDLRLEAYSDDEYQVIEGKALNELQDDEIAISKEFASTFVGSAIGQELEFYNHKLIVQSVIAYPNYELTYQPLETLHEIPLFREGTMASGITTEKTINDINMIHIPKYWTDLGYIGLYDDLVENTNMLLKINYDNFSFDKERELMNFINYSYTVRGDFYDNIYSFDSLAILTKSNPLVEMLKSSISKFVVSMIVLSSTYAFYIHLKNELHSKRKTLATLNIIGVSFKEILKTYFIFFMKIFTVSYLITIGITYILGIFKRNFRPNPFILTYLFGLSLIFFMLIFGIFIISLFRNRAKGYEEITSGGLSYIHLKDLKQERLISGLAMKRFTKTINLTIGFALSLALSIAVVLISMSSLNSIKNVYQQETLGLNFDYYISNPNLKFYRELKEKGMDVAAVYKETNVNFLDYELNRPVDNLTTGSTITIYDDIEPFTTLDLGEYPPHVSTWFGESYDAKLYRIDIMVSKRLMDTNGLYVSSDPNGPVDKHYLFTKVNVNDYERALPIRGSFVTLMDRGFINFNYQMLNERGIEKGLAYLNPIIVKVNDTMDRASFEELLKQEKMDYIHIDKILKEFSKSNEKVNQDSFDILLVIIVAMTIQTIFNLSGVLVQVKLNKDKEDEFYHKIGLRNKLLKKVHQSELTLRFIMTSIFVLILSFALLPLLNKSISEAFAIIYLPKTLLKEILLTSGLIALVLSLINLVNSKYKVKT